MRELLLLITLIISGLGLFAQSNYTIDNAKIHDLPNGEFLTAYTQNEKAYLKHIDQQGNVIWEDSLLFYSQYSPVYFGDISHFKETDEYIISLFADPTMQTPYWDFGTNDTLVYQFTKLDLANHAFTYNLLDTFVCKGIHSLEINDTSIYLFVSDFSQNSYPFNQATYSLNQNMEISMVAPSDSIQTNPWNWRFEYDGNYIYHQQFIEEHHEMDIYDLEMSLIDHQFINLPTTQDYSGSLFVDYLNSDSMFVFTAGSTSGSPVKDWRMDWLALDLTSINSVVFNAQTIDQSLSYYHTYYDRIAIDRENRRVVVMTADLAPIPTGQQEKIFIYDFDFNFVCEIPTGIGPSDDASLIELNGNVYLRNNHDSYSDLFLISCDVLSTDALHLTNEPVIYPNPTNSVVDITFLDNESYDVNIYSLDGQKLDEYLNQSESIHLKLSGLPSGVYLIECKTDSKTSITRIVKH